MLAKLISPGTSLSNIPMDHCFEWGSQPSQKCIDGGIPAVVCVLVGPQPDD